MLIAFVGSIVYSRITRWNESIPTYQLKESMYRIEMYEGLLKVYANESYRSNGVH